MSTAAGAAGVAGTAEGVAGPPLTGPQEVALALLEVATAAEAAERMRAKAAKAEAAAAEIAQAAEEGLAVAGAAYDRALERACELTGIDDSEQVASLAAGVAAEMARHAGELDRLTAPGGEG